MDTTKLEAVLDAFNRHDLDGILAFFDPGATFDAPRGPFPFGTRYVGEEEVRAGFRARFDGIPDVQYDDARHFVAGDRGVSEWRLSGTDAAGRRIDVRGCDLWEFAGDRIVHKDSYWKIVEPAPS
jgi:ketosteroid isomerase-like protein